MRLELPTTRANDACYELVRQTTPELWEAFERRLIPLAGGDGAPEERIPAVRQRADEIWADFLEHDRDRRARALGRSWSCCVDDLVAAVVKAAIPAIAAADEPVERRRERLEALRALLAGQRPASFTGVAIGFDLQRAIHDLD
jgi:hypothetical protein